MVVKKERLEKPNLLDGVFFYNVPDENNPVVLNIPETQTLSLRL